MPSHSPEHSTKTVSFFEFWPTWVLYLPVVFQWLLLSIRHRSLTLPLLANPNIPLAGMVGGSKHQIMSQSTNSLRHAILPWILYTKSSQPLDQQTQLIKHQLQEADIPWPFVCKPDTGCRGAGVKLVHTMEELSDAIRVYPSGSGIICQQLSKHTPEAGIFFVKLPGEETGQVVSLTLKHTPAVIGDGLSTLEELVSNIPRASQLTHLYQQRNQRDWHRVIEAGERVSLLFSASHCRGAVFEDARHFITPELNARMNQLMSDMPDFYYGRLDVRFPDTASLQHGRNLDIVEINGASSESIHIWDKNARLGDAIRTLLWQYRTLFHIGAYQRQQGRKTPGIRMFIRRWHYEQTLTRHYPDTD